MCQSRILRKEIPLLQVCLEKWTTHQIKLDLDNTKIVDEGDRNRLGQVIINLLSNAIKYSPGSDSVVIISEKIEHQIKL